MATIDYYLSAPAPVEVEAQDDAGNPITDIDMQLRIPVDDACLTIDGVVVDGAYTFDLSGLDLTAQLYPLRFYGDSGEGWRLYNEARLLVHGGC